MTTNNETLPVIQSDRDAAADYILFGSLGPNCFVDHLREGKADNTTVVQAFARHRIAAESRLQREDSAELERLRHDLSRQIAITTEQANEIEALRAALKDTNSPSRGEAEA